MLVFILSYVLHLLVALVFFILLPLPVIIRATSAEGQEQLRKVLRIYKVVLLLGHGALIVSVITGLILRFEFSLWMATVLLIWIVIGAYLGLTAKYVRMSLEAITQNNSYEEEIQKARLFSMLLTLGIIAMFIMKFAIYF